MVLLGLSTGVTLVADSFTGIALVELFGVLIGAAGAFIDDDGVDGALVALYPVSEQPDLTTSSAGQVTTSQSTLKMLADEYGSSIEQDIPRIISSLHPVPAEVTAGLKRSWELGAGIRARSAVLRSPDSRGSAPLGSASIIDAKAASRNLAPLVSL